MKKRTPKRKTKSSKVAKSSRALIKTDKVVVDFIIGEKPIHVLREISLDIFPGEFVIIYGPSGCGKSTLLNVLYGLQHPNAGKVYLRGENLFVKRADERARIRNSKIGMVHQMPYWIKSLNVVENVALPLNIGGQSRGKALIRAYHLLRMIGLDKLANHRPTELSGGEQQRASLARAMSTNPWVLFADEPTGSLDTDSAIRLMEYLINLNAKSKRTIVMVTHNLSYLKYATKVINMVDGKVVRVETKKRVHTSIEGEETMKDMVVEEALKV